MMINPTSAMFIEYLEVGVLILGDFNGARL